MRRLVAVMAVCAAAFTLSSCVDSRTDPPPPPVNVTAQDLYGKWSGWGRSSLTLAPHAKASTVKLDGQEFNFDDAWRMTGTGTWSVLKPGAYRGGNTVGTGSVIHLEIRPVSAAKASASRSPSASPNPTVAASRTEPPPDQATWDIGVTKGKKGELLLVFLTSDPDVRDTYYLTKGGTETP